MIVELSHRELCLIQNALNKLAHREAEIAVDLRVDGSRAVADINALSYKIGAHLTDFRADVRAYHPPEKPVDTKSDDQVKP